MLPKHEHQRSDGDVAGDKEQADVDRHRHAFDVVRVEYPSEAFAQRRRRHDDARRRRTVLATAALRTVVRRRAAAAAVPVRDRSTVAAASSTRRVGNGVGRGWFARRAAEAAQTATDVSVDETKRRRHEATEVRDRQKRQRDADDGVEHCNDLAEVRLRRDVTVACNEIDQFDEKNGLIAEF